MEFNLLYNIYLNCYVVLIIRFIKKKTNKDLGTGVAYTNPLFV